MSDWTHALHLVQALVMFAFCAILLTPRLRLSQRLRVPVTLTAFVVSAATLIVDIS